MNSRLWPGTEKYIDRFYLIGKKACDVGRKVYPKLDKKIRMTGWPRVDLWRPEFNYLYKNSIKDLKKITEILFYFRLILLLLQLKE